MKTKLGDKELTAALNYWWQGNFAKGQVTEATVVKDAYPPHVEITVEEEPAS